MRWGVITIIVSVLLVVSIILFLNFEFEGDDDGDIGYDKGGDLTNDNESNENGQDEVGDGCDEVLYDFPPVNLERTTTVVPLGLMSGNHVTPVDHQYFQNFDNDLADIEVYSPADGVVREMQYMTGGYFDSGRNENVEWADFRIIIDHDCSVSSVYIHIDELSDKLLAVAPEKGGYRSVNVNVAAGEVIGWYANNVDYNLVDLNFVLDGFVVPENYVGEDWKIHVPNTFDYFNDEITQKMILKSLRVDEPIAGKFDYDIDGRLIGNWFLEGTNGYSGLRQENYWVGHLSISPDYIDPSHFIFSTGDYEGEPQQFGVKGNSPFPSDVSVGSGIVVYELVDYEYYLNENRWDRMSLARGLKAKNSDRSVRGVVLLEMLEDRVLKVEVFPGKTASEVGGLGEGESGGFTDGAKIYVR